MPWMQELSACRGPRDVSPPPFWTAAPLTMLDEKGCYECCDSAGTNPSYWARLLAELLICTVLASFWNCPRAWKCNACIIAHRVAKRSSWRLNNMMLHRHPWWALSVPHSSLPCNQKDRILPTEFRVLFCCLYCVYRHPKAWTRRLLPRRNWYNSIWKRPFFSAYNSCCSSIANAEYVLHDRGQFYAFLFNHSDKMRAMSAVPISE